MITKTAYQIYANNYNEIPEEVRRYAGYEPGALMLQSPYYSADRCDTDRQLMTEDYNFYKNREAFLRAYPYIKENEDVINDRYPDLIDAAAMNGSLETWKERTPNSVVASGIGGALLGGLVGLPLGGVFGKAKAGALTGAALGGLGTGLLTYRDKTSDKAKKENALADSLVRRLRSEYDKNAW